jgi:hypothetical protein
LVVDTWWQTKLLSPVNMFSSSMTSHSTTFACALVFSRLIPSPYLYWNCYLFSEYCPLTTACGMPFLQAQIVSTSMTFSLMQIVSLYICKALFGSFSNVYIIFYLFKNPLSSSKLGAPWK